MFGVNKRKKISFKVLNFTTYDKTEAEAIDAEKTSRPRPEKHKSSFIWIIFNTVYVRSRDTFSKLIKSLDGMGGWGGGGEQKRHISVVEETGALCKTTAVLKKKSSQKLFRVRRRRIEYVLLYLVVPKRWWELLSH